MPSRITAREGPIDEYEREWKTRHYFRRLTSLVLSLRPLYEQTSRKDRDKNENQENMLGSVRDGVHSKARADRLLGGADRGVDVSDPNRSRENKYGAFYNDAGHIFKSEDSIGLEAGGTKSLYVRDEDDRRHGSNAVEH